MSLLLSDLKTAYLGKVVRRHDGYLEIADVTYRHPCGHQVRLIGAVHVASQQSWERLDNTLRDAISDGWAVHLEGIQGKVSDPHLQPLADDLKAITGHVATLLGGDLGLTKQWGHIPAPPGAQQIDLTIADLAPNLDPAKVRALRLKTETLKLPTLASGDKAAEKALRAAISAILCAPTLLTGRFLNALLRRVIIDQRNAYAIDRALQEERNVTLFWGANHLPGMARILYRAGYRITAHRWRPAIRLADITLPKPPQENPHTTPATFPSPHQQPVNSDTTEQR